MKHLKEINEKERKKGKKKKTLFPIARFGRSKKRPTEISLIFFFFSIDANPLSEARLFRSTNARVMVYSDLFITYVRSR